MRIVRNKRGQFIIIAIMMIALMMISVGAIMYGTGTYYRYEQWDEYLTLVEHVKLNTVRLVEISLANYTAAGNNSILKDSLDQWQNDLRKAYPGYGVILTYDLANASHQVYGTNINYSGGLASHWDKTVSCSAANATFTLNITSTGLKGYKFMATPFLNLTIYNIDPTSNEIKVIVTGENGMFITNLEKDNFEVDGLNKTGVVLSYEKEDEMLVYIIKCDTSPPLNAMVTVWDQRGVKVEAIYQP